MVVCLIITLLLLVHKMCQWKNFENRSIFDEDMDNQKVGRFFETQCTVKMFKMSACYRTTGIETLSPFLDSRVNNVLHQTNPDFTCCFLNSTFLKVICIFYLFCFFLGSAEADIRWGGNQGSHLMASCVENICNFWCKYFHLN